MVATEPTWRWEDAYARRTRQAGGPITAILALAGASDLITFSGGFPAPETFPTDALADIAAEVIRTDAATALQYAPTPGLPGLRDVLTERIAATQGRRPADDELLVTSGGIDALALIGRALLDQGDLVGVEAPTYLGAITAFRGYEAEICEIDVDLSPGEAAGIDVDALDGLLRAGRRPKLIYVIPDHHNPTGVGLGADKRARLVELCRHHGILLIEDVAYRELGDDATAPPSLWSLGPDVVVQMGTFSKTFFPGVRLGWAVGPAAVVAEMVTAKQNSDQCAGALGQRLVEEHIRRGGYDAQLPRSRALYRERRAAMLDACAAHLPPGVTWTRPSGGFFTWLTGPGAFDAAATTGRAEAAGVAYVPGAPFYAGAGRGTNQIRLAYSRATTDEIHEGMRRLGPLLAAGS